MTGNDRSPNDPKSMIFLEVLDSWGSSNGPTQDFQNNLLNFLLSP